MLGACSWREVFLNYDECVIQFVVIFIAQRRSQSFLLLVPLSLQGKSRRDHWEQGCYIISALYVG